MKKIVLTALIFLLTVGTSSALVMEFDEYTTCEVFDLNGLCVSITWSGSESEVCECGDCSAPESEVYEYGSYSAYDAAGRVLYTAELAGIGDISHGELIATPVADKFVPAPVPEPATCILVGLGLVGLAMVKRRKLSEKLSW